MTLNFTPSLIHRDYDGHTIQQRETDGYLNATTMCQAAGRHFAAYRRLDGTKEFIKELSSCVQIHTDELIQSVMGAPSTGGGTWVHPDVAVHLAQWLSPRFAVMVSRWVRELLMLDKVGVRPAPMTPVVSADERLISYLEEHGRQAAAREDRLFRLIESFLPSQQQVKVPSKTTDPIPQNLAECIAAGEPVKVTTAATFFKVSAEKLNDRMHRMHWLTGTPGHWNIAPGGDGCLVPYPNEAEHWRGNHLVTPRGLLELQEDFKRADRELSPILQFNKSLYT